MNRIVIILLGILIPLGIAACGSDEAAKKSRSERNEKIKGLGGMVDPGPSKRFQEEDENYIVRSFDINNDNTADLWKLFDHSLEHADDNQATMKLKRKEVDSNFDGEVDMWLFYNDQERLMREEADANFDGDIDLIERFEKGRVVQRELFKPGRDKPRARKRYREGRLYMIELDVDDDGTFDRWEVFYEGRLTQVGHDSNNDEEVDYWEDYSNLTAEEENDSAGAPEP